VARGTWRADFTARATAQSIGESPGTSKILRMNPTEWHNFLPVLAVAPFMLLNLAWHVAVIVFLYKIWKRVRQLPG
jgi:hypothetical protein